MAGMILVTQKTLGGDTWVNTHAVMVGVNGASQPTDDDLTAIGAAAPLTTANTAANGSTNIIQAICAFERAMLAPDASITRVYITDGKRNDLTAVDSYAVLGAQLPGLSGGVAPFGAGLAPGAVSLMVNRNPAGFSHRPGRMYLRAALADASVKFGGPNMIDWTDNATRDAFVSQVNTAVTSSRIALYFLGGTNAATAMYAVPKYVGWLKGQPKPSNLGELIGCQPVASLTVGGPAIRQANRGRKRTH